MIKLKIGDNHLITTNRDGLSQSFICYMMSRYKGHGRVVLGIDPRHSIPPHLRANCAEDYFRDYAQGVREAKVQSIDILLYLEANEEIVRVILNLLPNIKVKFIKITKEDINSREFKMAWQIVDAWKLDKSSILSHLSELDEYKELSNRYKNIPSEIKAVDDSIKAMKKQNKATGRKVTLKELEPLHLIEKAELLGNELILDIYPIQINPSEPLSKLYTEKEFENNRFLYETVKQLYLGGHFGMPKTRIKIRPDFIPEFLETRNHDFDDLFEVNNWSNVGYLHFGRGHLCGGEFNDVISHAGEHGLEYYFLALKQYISTANVRDIAGAHVWWYPIYNDKNELVYCAGLDILRHLLIEQTTIPQEFKMEIKDMSIPEFLEWKKRHGVSFHDVRYPNGMKSGCQTTQSNGTDTFLKVLERKEPELFKTIMKGSR